MTFKSQDSYFDFAKSVLQHARYIHTSEAQEFLVAVRETARQREIEIPSGTSLWRAQRGQDSKDIYTPDGKISLPVGVAYPPERMYPRKERAPEGRVNPKGIPCLYLATAPATALAEARPPLGGWVSVGTFESLRNLRVVNCGHTKFVMGGIVYVDHVPERRTARVWARIDHAFSEPIRPEDDVADYAPTQILAELFRSMGYDGLLYRSAQNDEGVNAALFDVRDVRLTQNRRLQVAKVRYETREGSGGYDLSPDGTQTLIPASDEGWESSLVSDHDEDL